MKPIPQETELLQSANPKGYVLLEEIGEGGFGKVYKAEQIATGQIVAIKIFRFKEFQGLQKKRQLLTRFERETEICAKINHPHIVRFIDKGYAGNDEPFAVFEYVSGETLKDLILRNGGLPAKEAGELMGQVLEALSCAHARGIVHRDLKPHNIMVTKTGSRHDVKVLDFGISAFTHDTRTIDYKNLTLAQEVLGTPVYCAPEQLRGEPITVKSDLYAWGLILIECLTGEIVMRGNSVAEVFQRQLNSTNVPIPPAILAHPLADLLKKTLNKNPLLRMGEAALVLKEYSKINFSSLVGKIQSHQFSPKSIAEVTGINQLQRNKNTSEKKQITVLCAKISLLFSGESVPDIETLDTIQNDQLNLCKDTAIRFGGHIAGMLADHVLIYFGYPQASDSDARRAGRTALELVEQVQRRSPLLYAKYGIQASVRIGMNSGTVIARQDHPPEGLVPNNAFNLLYHAQPGIILVTEITKKLLEPFWKFDVSEKYNLHHSTQPVQSYRLIDERQVEAFSFFVAGMKTEKWLAVIANEKG